MNHTPIKPIEFAFIVDKNPYIGLFDAYDISRFLQNDETSCKLVLKDKNEYIVSGTYRTLTNRWLYALQLSKRPYEDVIMMPSIMITHRVSEIEVDPVHFDKIQWESLINALRPQLLIDNPQLLDQY